MGGWVSDDERIRKDGVMSDDKNILHANMKLAKNKLLYKILYMSKFSSNNKYYNVLEFHLGALLRG